MLNKHINDYEIDSDVRQISRDDMKLVATSLLDRVHRFCCCCCHSLTVSLIFSSSSVSMLQQQRQPPSQHVHHVLTVKTPV